MLGGAGDGADVLQGVDSMCTVWKHELRAWGKGCFPMVGLVGVSLGHGAEVMCDTSSVTGLDMVTPCVGTGQFCIFSSVSSPAENPKWVK